MLKRLFTKKFYECGTCGYRTVHKIKKCLTCGAHLEEVCYHCRCVKGVCRCRKNV